MIVREIILITVELRTAQNVLFLTQGGYDHINNLLREEVFTKAVERNIREMEEKDRKSKEDK